MRIFAKKTASTGSKLRGKLEGVRGREIVGWLWDPDTPHLHVAFSLLINGEVVGDFVADQLRQDLKSKGIGDGDHLFRIQLRDGWLKNGGNLIEVLASPPHDGTFRASHDHAGEKPQFVPQVVHSPSPVLPLTLLAKSDERLGKAGAVPRLDAESVGTLLEEIFSEVSITDAQIAAILNRLFGARRHHEVVLVGRQHLAARPKSYPIRNLLGRALLHVGRHEEAVDVLWELRKLAPDRHAALYYLALALKHVYRFKDAYATLAHCIAVEDGFKYRLEAGRTATWLAFGGYGTAEHRAEFLPLAIADLDRARELAPGDHRPLRELAQLHLHVGDTSKAYELARSAVEGNADRAPVWQTLSEVCVRMGRFSEAMTALERAATIAPDADWPRFGIRMLQRFAADTEASGTVVGVGLADDAVPRKVQLAEARAQWVFFDADISLEAAKLAVRERGFSGAAGVVIDGGDEARGVIWRRSWLLRLFEAGVLDADAGFAEVQSTALRVGEVIGRRRPALALGRRPLALLISQYGIEKFGGAEQFLAQMATLYEAMGYDVLVVGTRAEFVGRKGSKAGLRYTFVALTPDALLKLAVEEAADIIHVVSGLGFEVASALRYLRARIVFGVHFWRELFFSPTPSGGYYPDIDKDQKPRPEFLGLLEQCAAIYSNSTFTRETVEKHFGVRTPILYSLPDDRADDAVPPLSGRRYVFLANSRVDKGFGLLLDVAALLPRVEFLAIASQSDKSFAANQVRERGLTNVTLLDRVDDMDSLYRHARVALVPSFHFIETFSRVVIEAHRFGVPVIGSDRGNVPRLLQTAGLALPEEPSAWAREIERLYEDESYWNTRSQLALENSARYSFAQQHQRLSGIVKATTEPLLVGVGSGLGNVIHAAPLLRNLARRLGRRVDVVVAGDYTDLLFCLANGEYVNHVFMLNETVLRRRYDKVFLTHSFGSFVPTFSAQSVLCSRNWDLFRADHSLHEAEFNLAACQALLGVPYQREDVAQYYLGDLRYEKPDTVLVGLHGGSKGGIWASKRWPHYDALAQRLKEQGYPVASFGTPDEYVPGTIDCTGGSIEEMANAMLACTHFVANDSGVMNVANALGIPLVALFAPTNVSTRGPLASTSRAIASAKDCSPCETHTTNKELFRSGTCRCISEISVDQVIEAFRTL